MPRMLVLPHRSVALGSCDGLMADEWQINGVPVDQVETSPQFIFSPADTVRFVRQFECRPEILGGELDQGSSARFQIAVEVRSSKTGLRTVIVSDEFSALNQNLRVKVQDEIAGAELGGTIFLATRLLLTRPDPKSDIAAKVSGDVLLLEQCIVPFEREIATFPHFEPANLNGYLGIFPGPPWIIDVDTTNLEVDASQAVTVSVNERSPIAPGLIGGADASGALRKALACDIRRALIAAALGSPEFCDRAEDLSRDPFEVCPKSLGAVLRQALLAHGFNSTVSQAIAMRETRYSEFEARIVNRLMR